jgi:preprotein translocase subunit SecF
MELFRIKRDIPFMRHALVFNIISFVTFALAVFFLVTRGLHLSIEFTGGTVLEVQYAQAANIEKTRTTVEALGYGEVQVQKFGTSRDVLIRVGGWSERGKEEREVSCAVADPRAAAQRRKAGRAGAARVCRGVQIRRR